SCGGETNGAHIIIEPGSITLGVGPKVTGSSITLSATSIKLKVGTVSFEMSLSGIEETAVPGLVVRKAGAAAHQLNAAETSIKVGVEGITEKAPFLKQSIEALAQIEATIYKASFSGMKQEKAPMMMLG